MQRKYILGQICIQFTSAFVPIFNPKDEEKSQGNWHAFLLYWLPQGNRVADYAGIVGNNILPKGVFLMPLSVRKRFEKSHRNFNYLLNSSLQTPQKFISWNLHALYQGCTILVANTKSLKRLRTIAFEVRILLASDLSVLSRRSLKRLPTHSSSTTAHQVQYQ